MTRTRSLATDIQITLTLLAILVFNVSRLHGVCRFPEIPITRRRLAFKDVSSNREIQRDESRLIRRAFFLFSPRYRERGRLKRRRRSLFIRVSTGETILEIPAGPRRQITVLLMDPLILCCYLLAWLNIDLVKKTSAEGKARNARFVERYLLDTCSKPDG